MVPVIATQKPTTLHIEARRMRGHGGHWGMAHLVFACYTFVRSLATIAGSRDFVTRSQAVV